MPTKYLETLRLGRIQAFRAKLDRSIVISTHSAEPAAAKGTRAA